MKGQKVACTSAEAALLGKNKLPVLQWKPASRRVFSFSGNTLFCFLPSYIFMCSNCCFPCLIFKSSDPSLCESPLPCVILNMLARAALYRFPQRISTLWCVLPWPHPPGPQEIDILQVCSFLYGLPSLSDCIWMSSIWWLASTLGV